MLLRQAGLGKPAKCPNRRTGKQRIESFFPVRRKALLAFEIMPQNQERAQARLRNLQYLFAVQSRNSEDFGVLIGGFFPNRIRRPGD
jgi:hypothetical protein